MTDRIIYHVDCNSFFASCNIQKKPWLRDKNVAIVGDPETRHGIILAKNDLAKRFKIPTGAPMWQARQLCRDLVFDPADYLLYEDMHNEIQGRILTQYTDLIQKFGMDECWMDVTGSVGLFGGDGYRLANHIRQQVKRETGITVSIGISHCKVFSKLGSDYKKPDAVTIIDQRNYTDIAWPLPVEEMIMVGSKTKSKLNSLGIRTIGELAQTEERFLRDRFGKIGSYLWIYANGEDDSPVADDEPPLKNIGHSAVVDHDVTANHEVKQHMYDHAANIGMRLRKHNLVARTIVYWICDSDMGYVAHQCPLPMYTNLDNDLAETAYAHFLKTYRWGNAIRKVGLTATNLDYDDAPYQLTFWQDAQRHQERTELQVAMDNCNKRWPHSVKRGITMYGGHKEVEDTKDMQRKFTPIGWLKGG